MTVLPVYNILLVPHSRLYLRAGLYKSISGRAPEIGEKVTLLVAKEPSARQEMTHESFYPIGLSGVIREVGDEGYITIETGSRLDVESVENIGPDRMDVIMSRREDTDPAEVFRPDPLGRGRPGVHRPVGHPGRGGLRRLPVDREQQRRALCYSGRGQRHSPGRGPGALRI